MLLPSDDVVVLRELGHEDKKDIGDELSSMGELAYNGVRFSPSFVITNQAFINFKNESNLHVKIKHLLGSMNKDRHDSVIQISNFIKNHIKKSEFPNTFVKKVFREYEKIEKIDKKVNLTLTSYFIHKGVVVKKEVIENISGESTLISSVREIWTKIFEKRLLSLNEMTHENHHNYGVTILVTQKTSPQISGYIKTSGEKHEKHHFIIEAIENVRITYNKSDKKVESGVHLSDKWQDVIKPSDIKRLIEIAEIADKKLYHPHIIHWAKSANIYVTGITPVTYKTDYYSHLESIKGVPLHPGVRIGRVRLHKKNHDVVMSNEEVVIVKSLTKPILESIRRAAAIISEDNLNAEIRHYLKERGIPTIERVNDAYKSFRNGEIVTVDATNGEVRHGSILIS